MHVTMWMNLKTLRPVKETRCKGLLILYESVYLKYPEKTSL